MDEAAGRCGRTAAADIITTNQRGAQGEEVSLPHLHDVIRTQDIYIYTYIYMCVRPSLESEPSGMCSV